MSEIVAYNQFVTKTYDMGAIRFSVNKDIEYYNMLYKFFVPYARKASSFLCKAYYNSSDIVDFMDNYYDYIFEALNEPIHAAVQQCLNLGYTDISEDYIITCMQEFSQITDLGKIYDQLEEAVSRANERYSGEVKYRENRKNSRSRVVGGGIGLSNAIKGMATASAINTASGLVHSGVNVVGNIGSMLSKRSTLKALSNDRNIGKELNNAIEYAVCCIPGVLFKYFTKRNTLPNSERADELYNKIRDYDLNDSQKKAFFIEIFSQFPYKMQYYELFQRIYGNNAKVDAVAKEFGLSVEPGKQQVSNSFGELPPEPVFDFSAEASEFLKKYSVKEWAGSSDRTPIIYDNGFLFLFEKHMREYCEKFGEKYDMDLMPRVNVIYSDGKSQTCRYAKLFNNEHKYVEYDYYAEINNAKKYEMHNIFMAVDKKNLNSIDDAIRKIKKIQAKCNKNEWGGDGELSSLYEYRDALFTVNGKKYSSIEEANIARKKYENKNEEVGRYFIDVFTGDKAIAQLLFDIYIMHKSNKDLQGDDPDYYLSDKNSKCTRNALEKTKDKYGKAVCKEFEDGCRKFISNCEYYGNLDFWSLGRPYFLKIAGFIISIIAALIFLILLFSALHFGFFIEAALYFVIILYIIFAGYEISEIFSDYLMHKKKFKAYTKNNKRDSK